MVAPPFFCAQSNTHTILHYLSPFLGISSVVFNQRARRNSFKCCVDRKFPGSPTGGSVACCRITGLRFDQVVELSRGALLLFSLMSSIMARLAPPKPSSVFGAQQGLARSAAGGASAFPGYVPYSPTIKGSSLAGQPSLTQRSNDASEAEVPSAVQPHPSANHRWTPVQFMYRRLMVSLRDAYLCDRAQLFWARHRVKVEIYKYQSLERHDDSNGQRLHDDDDVDVANASDSSVSADERVPEVGEVIGTPTSAPNAPSSAVVLLCQVGNEVAQFVSTHMRVSVQSIVDHNDMLAKLPVNEAKEFRSRYLEREREHVSWCKQKIRRILAKRTLPPYPYC